MKSRPLNKRNKSSCLLINGQTIYNGLGKARIFKITNIDGKNQYSLNNCLVEEDYFVLGSWRDLLVYFKMNQFTYDKIKRI